MKLLFVHIEGFGKLNNTDLRFEDGVNVITARNGWGKTTLTAFLFVMFYGFDSKATKKFREKYAPWEGGTYGGNIVFETEGKKYRVYRTFGTKKATDDTFSIRDYETNAEVSDFDEYLGEHLFKINAESFLKTVLSGNGAIPTSVTDDINAKIGNVSFMEADMREFTNALTIFRDYLNKNSATRKTGLLYDLKTELSGNFAKARFATGIRNELLDSETGVIALRDEIAKLRGLRGEINRLMVRIARSREAKMQNEHLEMLKSNLDECEKELDVKDTGKKTVTFITHLISTLLIPTGIASIFMLPSGLYAAVLCWVIGAALFLAGIFSEMDRKNRYAEVRNRAMEDYGRARTELERFIAGINIQEVKRLAKSPDATASLEEREAQLTVADEKLVMLEEKLKALEARREFLFDELSEAEAADAKAKELSELIAKKTKQTELAAKTAELLETAKASFAGRFVRPVNESLSRYFAILSGMPGTLCRLDPNLTLTVEASGLQRSEDVFSRGQRDVLGIAMRFALLDVMYDDEHPFVIMDDPFANLDSETAARAEKLIASLPYQVIIMNKS